VAVICTGDEHVALEHGIGVKHLRKIRHQFTDRGVRLAAHAGKPIEVHGRTYSCSYSPTAGKLNKYTPYIRYIRRTLGASAAVGDSHRSFTVLPLVFGVRGMIPTSTVQALGHLLQPQAQDTPRLSAPCRRLLLSIVHIIFRYIIIIWRAWLAQSAAAPNAAAPG
jgi:hypothetical protein